VATKLKIFVRLRTFITERFSSDVDTDFASEDITISHKTYEELKKELILINKLIRNLKRLNDCEILLNNALYKRSIILIEMKKKIKNEKESN
jgi:hypothetical protein